MKAVFLLSPRDEFKFITRIGILQKEYVADFLCYDSIIVEIKAIKKITELEEAQLLNYLNATKLPLGLIINFGTPKMEWKRFANTRTEGNR